MNRRVPACADSSWALPPLAGAGDRVDGLVHRIEGDPGCGRELAGAARRFRGQPDEALRRGRHISQPAATLTDASEPPVRAKDEERTEAAERLDAEHRRVALVDIRHETSRVETHHAG